MATRVGSPVVASTAAARGRRRRGPRRPRARSSRPWRPRWPPTGRLEARVGDGHELGEGGGGGPSPGKGGCPEREGPGRAARPSSNEQHTTAPAARAPTQAVRRPARGRRTAQRDRCMEPPLFPPRPVDLLRYSTPVGGRESAMASLGWLVLVRVAVFAHRARRSPEPAASRWPPQRSSALSSPRVDRGGRIPAARGLTAAAPWTWTNRVPTLGAVAIAGGQGRASRA